MFVYFVIYILPSWASSLRVVTTAYTLAAWPTSEDCCEHKMRNGKEIHGKVKMPLMEAKGVPRGQMWHRGRQQCQPPGGTRAFSGMTTHLQTTKRAGLMGGGVLWHCTPPRPLSSPGPTPVSQLDLVIASPTS